jgi:phosphatidate cytidylyltransferase
VALGNLAQRALVAVVAAPILLLILYHRRPEATWGLIFVASLFAVNELLGMGMKGPEHVRDRRFLLLTAGLACAALYWFHPRALVALHQSQLTMALANVGPLLAMMIGVVVPGLYFLARFGDMTTVAPRWAYAITAIFYCGFTATTLAMAKRDFDAGGDVVLLILLLAWVGDTGAYFAGRFLGKRKLYPEVSPKKTWAGAFGGLAGALAAAAIMKVLRFDEHGGHLSWLDVVLIAIPGGILGQLGDLVESLVKRSVGVKDSGTLLPGHGGMLDRIDAVLFIGPYVYLYLNLAR